ncbi:MAG: retropepsin-like domain-containing protein [Flavobacteriales bacterium]|nr:retropepsin-like domain-containing protein [Flavobacteriales bacterium]
MSDEQLSLSPLKPERRSFTGMHLGRITWWVLVIVSGTISALVIDFNSPAATWIGQAIGGSITIIGLPLLVLGLVVGVGKLFKHPPGQSARRTIFFIFWSLLFIGQIPRMFVKGQANENKHHEAFMTSCERTAKEKATFEIGSMYDVRKYCECVYESIKNEPISLHELESVKDRNSVLHNELAAPCLEGALLSTIPSYASVSGQEAIDTVPVLNTMQGYKLRMGLGQKEAYFLFDSGASDCFISASMESHLSASGSIQGHLPNMSYEMANGDIVDCRRVIVGGLRIGSFTVDSVVMAVFDKEVQFLLGKSLMDRFTSWTFTEQGTGLVLEK